MTGLSQMGRCYENAQQSTQWYDHNSVYSTRQCQQLNKPNYLVEPLISRHHTSHLDVNSYDRVKRIGKCVESAAFCSWLKSNENRNVAQAQHLNYQAKERSMLSNLQKYGHAGIPSHHSVMYNQQPQNSLNIFPQHSAGHGISLPQMPTAGLIGSQDCMTTSEKTFSSQNHHSRLNLAQSQTFNNRFTSNQNPSTLCQLFDSNSNFYQNNSSRMHDSCSNLYQHSHSNFTPLVNHHENQFMELAESANNLCQVTPDAVLTSTSHGSVNSDISTRKDCGPFQVHNFLCSGNSEVATTPAIEARNVYQMCSFPAVVNIQGIEKTLKNKKLHGSKHHHSFQPYEYSSHQASKISPTASKKKKSNNLTKKDSLQIMPTGNPHESHNNSDVQLVSDNFTMQRWYMMPTEENNNDKNQSLSCKDITTSKASSGSESGESVMSSSQTEGCSNSTSSIVCDTELHEIDSSSAASQHSQNSEESVDGDACMSNICNNQESKRFISSETSSDGESQMKEISDQHRGDLTTSVKLEPVCHDYASSDNLSEKVKNMESPEDICVYPTNADLTETSETNVTPSLLEVQERSQDNVDSVSLNILTKENLSSEASEGSPSCDDSPLPAIKYVPRKTSNTPLKPSAVSKKSTSVGDTVRKTNDLNSKNCVASKARSVRPFNDAVKSSSETRRKVHKVWMENHVKKNKSINVIKGHKRETSIKKHGSEMEVKLAVHRGKDKKRCISHHSVQNTYRSSKNSNEKHYSCSKSVSRTKKWSNSNSQPNLKAFPSLRHSDMLINSQKSSKLKKNQHLAQSQNSSVVKQRNSCKELKPSIISSTHSNIVKKRNDENLNSSKQCSNAEILKNISENVQKNVDIGENDVLSEPSKTSNQKQVSEEGKDPAPSSAYTGAMECCSLTFDKTLPVADYKEFETVKYHDKQLLCLTLTDGKYFVMKELIAKCFTVERKYIYHAKCRVLKIKHHELDQRYRKVVIEYLKMWAKPDTPLGIILVQDANKLYHILNQIKAIINHPRKIKAKFCVLTGSETKRIESKKAMSDLFSVDEAHRCSTDSEKTIAGNKDGSKLIQTSKETFEEKECYVEDEISSVSSDSTFIYCDGMALENSHSSEVFLNENDGLEHSSSTEVNTECDNTNKTERSMEMDVVNQKKNKVNICSSSDKCETGDEVNITSDGVFCSRNDAYVSFEKSDSVLPELGAQRDLIHDKSVFPVSLSDDNHRVSSQMTAKENYEYVEENTCRNESNYLAINEDVPQSEEFINETSDISVELIEGVLLRYILEDGIKWYLMKDLCLTFGEQNVLSVVHSKSIILKHCTKKEKECFKQLPDDSDWYLVTKDSVHVILSSIKQTSTNSNIDSIDCYIRDGDKHNNTVSELTQPYVDKKRNSSFNFCESTLENASQIKHICGINDSDQTLSSPRSGVISPSIPAISPGDLSEVSSDLQLGANITLKENSDDKGDHVPTTCNDQLTLCHSESASNSNTSVSSDLCPSTLATDATSSAVTSQSENTTDATDESAIPVTGSDFPSNVKLSADMDIITQEPDVIPEVKKEVFIDEQSSEKTDMNIITQESDVIPEVKKEVLVDELSSEKADKLNFVYEMFRGAPREDILNAVVDLCEKIHYLQNENMTLTSEVRRINEEKAELLNTAVHYENMVKEFVMTFKDAEED